MRLQLNGVSQAYGRKVVIDQLHLQLRPGLIGLLGPNGAGKTTLLRTMATIMPPIGGELSLGGLVVNSEASARKVRRHIGYLPQEFGFDPGMRVLDFVRYSAWMRGLPPATWEREVDCALTRVNLNDYRRAKLRTLSGGMRQRAGIAWAIVGEPALVLLDEPTVGLDPRQRLQFRKIIQELHQSIVVLSTHLIDDIDAVCDQVIVMNGGALKFVGVPAGLANLGRADLPGNTALERGYMSCLPAEEQRL